MTELRCNWHKKVYRSYTGSHAHAATMKKKGIKQIQCKICRLWHWPKEFGKPALITGNR